MITNLDILKRDLIRIENIKSFLVDIPKIHPDNPKYTDIIILALVFIEVAISWIVTPFLYSSVA